MKRSEMVAILERTINAGLYQDHQFDTHDVSKLLEVLEKAGMMPPIIEEESFKMLPSGELTYAVHEWEAE